LKQLSAILIVALAVQGAPAFSEERVDLDMLTKIRLEGFRDS